MSLERKKEDGPMVTETVNVEMQTTTIKHFTDRFLAYNAGLYSSQLKPGEKYDKLTSVYSLIFTTRNLKQFNKLKKRYYHTCSIREDDKPHLALTTTMRFIIVGPGKFNKSVDKLLDEKDA